LHIIYKHISRSLLPFIKHYQVITIALSKSILSLYFLALYLKTRDAANSMPIDSL
jgi:hypothetical protein